MYKSDLSLILSAVGVLGILSLGPIAAALLAAFLAGLLAGSALRRDQ